MVYGGLQAVQCTSWQRGSTQRPVVSCTHHSAPCASHDMLHCNQLNGAEGLLNNHLENLDKAHQSSAMCMHACINTCRIDWKDILHHKGAMQCMTSR